MQTINARLLLLTVSTNVDKEPVEATSTSTLLLVATEAGKEEENNRQHRLCRGEARNIKTILCQGFAGPTVNELFKQSLIDGPLRDFCMTKPFPGIPSCFAGNKDLLVEELQ